MAKKIKKMDPDMRIFLDEMWEAAKGEKSEGDKNVDTSRIGSIVDPIKASTLSGSAGFGHFGSEDDN